MTTPSEDPNSSTLPPAGQSVPGASSRRESTKFVLTFGVLAALAYVVATPGITEGTFLYPLISPVIEAATRVVALVSGAILSAFGEEVTVRGTLIHSPDTSIHIKRGCDGVLPTGLLLAAVLAFPSTWRQKLAGVAVGTVVLQAGNLIRVVSLYFVAKSGSQWVFDVLHEEVWQFLFIGLALLVFLWWAKRWVRVAP